MSPRPRVAAGFYKAHGHGNDYLVFPVGQAWTASAAAVARVTDPHRGPGADGIVIVDLTARPIALRMFNPDGGEFERSGNGLRVTAAWLWGAGHVGDDPFVVQVGGTAITMQVHGLDEAGDLDVEADMGQVRFGPEAVGLDPTALQDGALDHPAHGLQRIHPVSVGNPHAVLIGSLPDDARFQELGPWISEHPAFAAGTNVQFAEARGPDRAAIRIWERGVGPTAASGTSACAAAAALVRHGHLRPGALQVDMPGGVFRISVDPDSGVRLRGPVSPVCSGRLATALLAALG